MPEIKMVVLYTDLVLWGLLAVLLLYVRHVSVNVPLRQKWARVLQNKVAVACAAVLSVFFVIALVDSVHFRQSLPTTGQMQAWDTQTKSLLDVWVQENIAQRERSYSAPFALREFSKTTVMEQGRAVRVNQRLVGASPEIDEDQFSMVLLRKLQMAMMTSVAVLTFGWLAIGLLYKVLSSVSFASAMKAVTAADNPWRPAILVWQIVGLIVIVLCFVWPSWHVFGTDTTGNDVLYNALKSVRTAMVIGTLATFTTLPFAVFFGVCAGYFKGWVDDVIQYVSTTIS